MNKEERLAYWCDILEGVYTQAQKDIESINLDSEESLLFSVQILIAEGKTGPANVYTIRGFNDGCKVKEFLEEESAEGAGN